MKVTVLFTTFPVLSERFLQREVTALRDLGVELELFSLFRGKSRFEGLPVERFRWWHWICLPGALLREMSRSPAAFKWVFSALRKRRPPQPLNILENFLGFSFAVIWADHFRKSDRHHIHAVWATAPAAAAGLLKQLTGGSFSMGAHAYDVFRYGGDWLLETKFSEASLIHTSTEATRAELLRRGARPESVCMIRRGLASFPQKKPARDIPLDEAVRLLGIGRLIEKKGFDRFLRICAALREANIPFACRIVGAGPLRKKLESEKDSLELDSCIQFLGAQSYEEVAAHLEWADFFCFTGRIAGNNDRDGLPNVIAEAMAFGIPVLSSAVSGTGEAISHRKTGFLLDPETPREWIEAIRELTANKDLRLRIRRSARAWVEANFDSEKNARMLLQAFETISQEPS